MYQVRLFFIALQGDEEQPDLVHQLSG